MHRARIAIAIVLAIAVAPSVSRAHLGHVILRAERYIKLDASDEDTRLVVSLMLGPDEGERVLAAADRDEDGEVTRAEADAYLAQWGTGLRDEVPIDLDGAPVDAEWTDAWLDPIGRVRRVGLTVEMVAHVPTDAREHRIAYEDRMVRRETFDRTDIAFQAHDGAELLACGPGDEPTDCHEPDVAIVRGGRAPTRFTALVRYPRRSEPVPVAPIAGGVAALVAAAIAAIAVRRRTAR